MNIEDFITQLTEFMQNTNELIAKQSLEIENLRVDIEKLRKKFDNHKNNGQRIISSL